MNMFSPLSRWRGDRGEGLGGVSLNPPPNPLPEGEGTRMNKTEVMQRIRDIGVIPVVRASSKEEAILVAEAIKAGALSILDITMTVTRAVQEIQTLSARYATEPIVD